MRKAAMERRREHEERNEQRKLTKEEKAEKRKDKVETDKANEVQVALFRVADLSNYQAKWKIEINAQQLALTGCALLNDEMNLVVVEGGSKTIKKFVRLMDHRIDWSAKAEGADDAMDEDEARPAKANTCHLVWKGVTKAPLFKNFRFETSKTETAARKHLAQRNCAHYWDLCKNFRPDITGQ